MPKLMWIAGILLIAAGIAFGVVNLVSFAPLAKISLDTAAILLVGGILALGLGSVIDGLHAQRTALVERIAAAAAVAAPPVAVSEFTARAAKAPVEVAAAEQAEVAAEPAAVSESTRETINALEEARQKMEQAFQPKAASAEADEPVEIATAKVEEAVEAVADTVEDITAEDAVLEEEVVDDEAILEDAQLYVVEERFIRRRPARLLSDGTVEAETDEGWMRFENLEHLDEYLDAMDAAKR